MKEYSKENFLENLGEIVCPSYLTYTSVNDSYSDFICRFADAINFTAPGKRIRVKANSKPKFGNEIISAIQRQSKLYKKFKRSDLGTVTDNFKIVKNTPRENDT